MVFKTARVGFFFKARHPLPLFAFMYGCHGILAVNVEFKIEM